MRVNKIAIGYWSLAVAAALLLVSCASGPQPPQPGTPAFYWGAAQLTFKSGDYLKTNDNLSQLVKSENEFTERAQRWELVLAPGMAQGYMELADNYDLGARMNRQNPTPFRKQATQYRSLASALLLQYTEIFHKWQDAHKDPKVGLPFEYPMGNSALPQEVQKIAKGMLLQPSEQDKIATAMLQRGVLLATCRALGAPNDAAKALETFKTGNVEVPLKQFLLAQVKQLLDGSELFGPTKLDQPNRAKMLYTEATEALQTMPESKEAKELAGKIQKNIKKWKIG